MHKIFITFPKRTLMKPTVISTDCIVKKRLTDANIAW